MRIRKNSSNQADPTRLLNDRWNRTILLKHALKICCNESVAFHRETLKINTTRVVALRIENANFFPRTIPIPKISKPSTLYLSLPSSYFACTAKRTKMQMSGSKRCFGPRLLLRAFPRPILVDATPNAENRRTRTGARQQNVPAALSPRLPSTYISYFFPLHRRKIRFRGCFCISIPPM